MAIPCVFVNSDGRPGIDLDFVAWSRGGRTEVRRVDTLVRVLNRLVFLVSGLLAGWVGLCSMLLEMMFHVGFAVLGAC